MAVVVLVFCSLTVSTAYASTTQDSIDDAKEQIDDLQEQKEEAEKELDEKTERWVYLNEKAEAIENQKNQ